MSAGTGTGGTGDHVTAMLGRRDHVTFRVGEFGYGLAVLGWSSASSVYASRSWAMLKSKDEGDGGKGGSPGVSTDTPKPMTKMFTTGAPLKGLPPTGTPRKTMMSPLPPPYLYSADGGLPGGIDSGSNSQQQQRRLDKSR